MVNMPRLEDALQVLFTKERMAGSEQYFCSSWARRRGMTLRCQKKCDAEVLTKIESLPAHSDYPHAASSVRSRQWEPDQADERRADSAGAGLHGLLELGRCCGEG